MSFTIRQEVAQLHKLLVSTRRQLHSNPELSFQEFDTCEYIVSWLHKHLSQTLEIHRNVGRPTAIVAIIQGHKGSGPCIALRADMDALPIQEDQDVLEFASRRTGVMHACGHDGHLAMLLVAAKVIYEARDRMKGCVKLVFQPGEEGYAGAKYMVDAGCLENPKVDQIYGIHVWSYLKCGVVGVKKGPLMASSERFEIELKGLGGHGAAPQGTKDTLVAGAHLATQLHTIVSRNIAPLKSAVVTLGTFNCGCAPNVIADSAKISGTVRAFEEPVLDTVHSRMRQICQGIEQSFGVEVNLNPSTDIAYPVTENTDDECIENVRKAAKKIVTSEMVIPPISTMAAEDFSFFLQKIPGCFFFLGSYPGEPDPSKDPSHEYLDRPHHKRNFDLNEDCLAVGASIWVQLIEDLLC